VWTCRLCAVCPHRTALPLGDNAVKSFYQRLGNILLCAAPIISKSALLEQLWETNQEGNG